MRIIIVGSGIAGLAAATFLQKDHEVLVIEKYEAINEVGAGVQLSPNASGLLLKFSDFSPQSAGAVYLKGRSLRDLHDRIVMDVDTDMQTTFGAPWISVHRHDLVAELQRILVEGGHNVKTLRGFAVNSIDTNRVSVKLSDGRTFFGDVIIGADGAWSVTRDYVLGPSSKPRVSSHAVYRLTVPIAKLHSDRELMDLLENDKLMLWVGTDRRVIGYAIRSSQVYNIVAHIPTQDNSCEATLRSLDKSGSKEDLLAQFSEAHPKLRRLFSLASEVKLWRLFNSEPYETWSKGSVVIIGDAAHTMFPSMNHLLSLNLKLITAAQAQGASQSIEDAEALAYFLRDTTPADVPSRLRAFYESRIERVSKLQKGATAAYEAPHKIPAVAPEQPSELLKRMQWVFGYTGIQDWLNEDLERQASQSISQKL